MDETRRCPYCAEDIGAEAVRCPHCRSRLTAGGAQPWYRDHPERRIAGVAAALAHAFGVPASAMRLGFIALTFLHLLGPLVYGLLWLLVPFRPEDESLAEVGLGRARDLVRQLRSGVLPGDHRP